MKKFENFKSSLDFLKTADRKEAECNKYVRIGVIDQFCFTFELAWKVMKEVLSEEGVAEASKGSPKAVLKLSYKYGLIDDADLWIKMHIDRNNVTHRYNEMELDILLDNIFEHYIECLKQFSDDIAARIKELDDDNL